MRKFSTSLKDIQGIVQKKAKYPRLTIEQARKRARLVVVKRLLRP